MKNDEIREEDLTPEQIEAVHKFGECWLDGYSRFNPYSFEAALRVWAWDRKVKPRDKFRSGGYVPPTPPQMPPK